MSLAYNLYPTIFYQYITVAGGSGCPGSTFCFPPGANPLCQCSVGRTGGNPVGGCCASNGDCATGLVCDTSNDLVAGSPGGTFRCIQAGGK